MAEAKDVNAALEENRKRAEESHREGSERLSKGKPTPTQEENDRAKLGEHILTHEDDGSGPDPHLTRTAEPAKPAAAYQTRHATAGRGSASSS